MKDVQRAILVLGLAAYTVASISAFGYVAKNAAFAVCTPTEASDIDRFQKSIEALDGVIDLAITLSTALVGIGAAVLVGLKSGVQLTPWIRALILLGTLSFAQSALYAVWWRMGVGELWLNECPSLISQPRLTTRYSAQFYFFMVGLVCLASLVVGAALFRPWTGRRKK